MKNKIELIKLALASIFIALGLLLPFITLNSQQLGSIFSLMHIPILIGGLVLGWKYGLVIGIITPILRHVIIGMPPLPIALSMMFELGTYGLVIALLKDYLPKKSYMVELALVIAMLAGRLVWGISAAVIYPAFGVIFSFKIFLTAAFVSAIPAIIIQLLLVPNIYYRLKTTGSLNIIESNQIANEEEPTI